MRIAASSLGVQISVQYVQFFVANRFCLVGQVGRHILFNTVNVFSLLTNTHVSSQSISNSMYNHQKFQGRWSDEIWVVVRIKGSTITLNDDSVMKRTDLLKVPASNTYEGGNVVSEQKMQMQRKHRRKIKPNMQHTKRRKQRIHQ